MMSNIILGIHGIGNKPPNKVLANWWYSAIQEGLRARGLPIKSFRFELIYWANFLYPEPLDPLQTNPKHDLYLEEPYVPAKSFVKKEAGKLRKKIADYVDHYLDKIFLNEDMSINYSGITDLIIHHFFKDLEIYFSSDCVDNDTPECLAKEAIRQHVASVLGKHRDKRILLIAHSMGSIIAYDVLTQSLPDLEIDTFITIGSPLGIPIIKSKMMAEQKKNVQHGSQFRTPENIRKNWFNFADLDDRVAIDHELGDDFEENSHHVKAFDRVVYNNYEHKGRRNPHKSYGYLRTPENAEAIHQFLSRGRSRLASWLSEKLNDLMPSRLGS